MAPTSNLHRRRKRRVLGTLGGTLLAWGVLAGLPIDASPATAGDLHTEIITLTGTDGVATAAASGQVDAGASTEGVATRAVPSTAGPGWSAHLDVDDGSQAVASSWTGAPDGIIEVRGLIDGAWGEWTEIEAEEGESPDVNPRNTGAMVWFGSPGIDQLEVRVVAGELEDLEVQTMRYDAPSGGSSLSTATAGADAAQPTILPRTSYTSKGWASANSGCSSGPQTASGGVKYAVVHHTVNSNTYAASDVPAMLASIYAYHTGTNGWCDIAYNFVIDRFGRIWEGRSGGIAKAIVGGHAQGFNTGSMGVSFLGQFEPGVTPTAADPSAAALDAAGKLIGWKLGLFGVDPIGTVAVTSGGSNKYPAGTSVTLNRIIGHRDVGQTACPGKNLYEELGAIRLIAKAAQGGSTTTTTTPTTTTTAPPPAAYAPFYSAAQLVTQQYRDVLRRDPSADDLAYWTARVGDTWSPGKFIAHLQSSAEADNRVHAVTRLYRAYFLRTPDHSGLTYWLNRRGEGRSLVSISSSFAGSSEFTNRYGKLSNRAFVDRVYLNVLGRSGDYAGLTYWTTRLNGGMSRGQVMANFSQSSEYVRKTNADAWVVGTYEGLLRRAADGDVFALFTAGLNNGQTTLTAISTYVYEGSEYRSRFR